MKKNIWVVCCETPDGFESHSHQLLYKASTLSANNDIDVVAICGNGNEQSIDLLSIYGANSVIKIDAKYVEYRQMSLMIKNIWEKTVNKPILIIFPSTEWGKCIAADLAIMLDAGLVAECIDIRISNSEIGDDIFFSRTAMDATMLVSIKTINTNVRICTCKKNIFDIKEQYPLIDIPIKTIKTNNNLPHTNISVTDVIDIIRDDTFCDSRIVFGVGRGIGEYRNLKLIETVAYKYNAMVVGTKASVDSGIIDKNHQVGQSGLSISPDIYVAIGISGATQHMVGIKNAKTIVAINNDKKAPIFQYCDYGIVCDYKSILYQLTKITDYNDK